MAENTPAGRHHPGGGSKHVHGLSSQHHLSTVEGDIESGRDVVAKSHVTAGESVRTPGFLGVGGPANIQGDLFANSTLNVSDKAVFGGDTLTDGEARFRKKVTADDDIATEGNISMNDGWAAGSVKVNGEFQADGKSAFGGHTVVGGPLVVTGTSLEPGGVRPNSSIISWGDVLATTRIRSREGYYITDRQNNDTPVLTDRMVDMPTTLEDPVWRNIPEDDHFSRTVYLSVMLDWVVKELRRVSLMKTPT